MIGALVLLIPYVWWQVLAWKSRMYVITNRRIIQMSGVFNKDVLDSAIRQITDLRTHQSWVGRMFGYGEARGAVIAHPAHRVGIG